MKRFALLLTLLSSPAMAVDTISLAIAGGTGGACTAAAITAGNFTCSAVITESDGGSEWHIQLLATFTQPCINVPANNGACTTPQVLAYIKTAIIQHLAADVGAFYTNTAPPTATMVPVQ